MQGRILPIKLELKRELDILFLGAFRSEEDDGREVELRDVKTQEEAAWRDILTRLLLNFKV